MYLVVCLIDDCTRGFTVTRGRGFSLVFLAHTHEHFPYKTTRLVSHNNTYTSSLLEIWMEVLRARRVVLDGDDWIARRLDWKMSSW